MKIFDTNDVRYKYLMKKCNTVSISHFYLYIANSIPNRTFSFRYSIFVEDTVFFFVLSRNDIEFGNSEKYETSGIYSAYVGTYVSTYVLRDFCGCPNLF